MMGQDPSSQTTALKKADGYAESVNNLKSKHDTIPKVRQIEQDNEVEQQRLQARKIEKQRRQQEQPGVEREATTDSSVINDPSTRQEESKRHCVVMYKQAIWEEDGNDTDLVYVRISCSLNIV